MSARQRFSTVLVVDPDPMAHVLFIHAAMLDCLMSLGMRCVSLSVQRSDIEFDFQGLQERGETSGSSSELVRWGDLGRIGIQLEGTGACPDPVDA